MYASCEFGDGTENDLRAMINCQKCEYVCVSGSRAHQALSRGDKKVLVGCTAKLMGVARSHIALYKHTYTPNNTTQYAAREGWIGIWLLHFAQSELLCESPPPPPVHKLWIGLGAQRGLKINFFLLFYVR